MPFGHFAGVALAQRWRQEFDGEIAISPREAANRRQRLDEILERRAAGDLTAGSQILKLYEENPAFFGESAELRQAAA